MVSYYYYYKRYSNILPIRVPDTQEADVDQIQMKRTEAKICLYSDSDSYGHEATL